MNDTKADGIAAAWIIGTVQAAETISAGNNNSTYLITAARGEFVLRIYQNTAELDQIRREHALLTQLARMQLSFRVPAPVRLPSGDTLLVVSNGNTNQCATLFERIVGRQPEHENTEHFRICGAALGELDNALARVDPAVLGVAAPPHGTFRIHPLVPEPIVMVQQLSLESTQRAQVGRIIEELAAALPSLYQSLPQQIVHADFDASNLLVDDNQVSGVLDFEFAGFDLRAYDLARSLSMFGISPWNVSNGWQLIEAFVEGYQQQVQLMQAEIVAMPDLMRLYRVWSLIHREGRRRQGLATEADVLARANGLLRQEEWLAERGDDLSRLFQARV